MKYLLYTLYFFSIYNIYSQENLKYTFIDIDGKNIKMNKFLNKWRDNKNNLYRWDYIKKDSGRVAKLYNNDFEALKLINQDTIVNYINTTFNKNITKEYTIVIEYYFKDDLCLTNSPPFKWESNYIIKRKSQYSNSNKNNIEKNKKTIFLILFENGSLVYNNPKTKDEYYFIDKMNFFPKFFLKDKTLCGSFIIIKPDLNILIGKGEKNVYFVSEYLKEENWKKIFN